MEYEVELKRISPNAFSYYAYWKQQEPVMKPHRQKASELLGIKVDGVPVSPALTKLADTLQRLEEMFDFSEIAEQGIDVNAMLSYMTEQQAIDELNEMGIEQNISVGEVENLLLEMDWQPVLEIPFVRASFSNLRQIEECPSGKMVDVSAFATVDYLRGVADFDVYKYFLDKTAERAKDLAIMHSAVTSKEGKEEIKMRFIALANNRFRNKALRLAAMHRACRDEEQRQTLFGKIQEVNRQIRRLRAIWKKYAYWE